MVRIGAFPGVSLAAARRIAKRHAGAVADGKDPAAEVAKTKLRAGSSLKALLAEDGAYEESLKLRRIVNANKIMRRLNRGLAKLMGKDVAQITRQDFVAAITAIEAQGKAGAAAD